MNEPKSLHLPLRHLFHIFLIGTAISVFTCHDFARAENPIADSAKQSVQQYRDGLEELANWCDEQGLDKEAKYTRERIRPSEPDKLHIPILPVEYNASLIPAEPTDAQTEWARRIQELRESHAEKLYQLSRTAISRDQVSLAFELIMAAIQAYPDHEACRRILGYRKYLNQWHTPYEIKRIQAGYVQHEDFGWILRRYVERYENGERFFQNRWMSKEEEAAARSGWTIETEHYTVHTNHSLEAGADVAQRLEMLYEVWRQIFIRYFATKEQVRSMFMGRATTIPVPRHEVVVFRDRGNYSQSLSQKIRGVENTVGLYSSAPKKAYFYVDHSSEAEATMFHEATHQLFQETRPATLAPAEHCNFWVMEGIACYMESLRQESGYYVIGGFEEDNRLRAATVHLIRDGSYVPLKDFTAMSANQFQSDPRLAMLYSQASGIMSFLVHHNGGEYRDALVAYLQAVYTGRDNPGLLAQLTGKSFEELDKEYREFITEGVQRYSEKRANAINIPPDIRVRTHRFGPRP